MKKYLLIELCVIVVLVVIIASCRPVSECGNGVCSVDKGETAATCSADCKEAPEEKIKETSVSINPASAEANQGDTITLEVMVSDVTDLFGFQFDINYNNEVLEFQKAQQGTFLNNNGAENTFCVDYKTSPGLVKNIVCTRFGSLGLEGSGLLETLTFKAIATGESDITLANVKLADPKASLIALTTLNGKVVVK
jgi:hypothetical protein